MLVMVFDSPPAAPGAVAGRHSLDTEFQVNTWLVLGANEVVSTSLNASILVALILVKTRASV